MFIDSDTFTGYGDFYSDISNKTFRSFGHHTLRYENNNVIDNTYHRHTEYTDNKMGYGLGDNCMGAGNSINTGGGHRRGSVYDY